jgi:hypothetical protein
MCELSLFTAMLSSATKCQGIVEEQKIDTQSECQESTFIAYNLRNLHE